jgi:hypothetical protein
MSVYETPPGSGTAFDSIVLTPTMSGSQALQVYDHATGLCVWSGSINYTVEVAAPNTKRICMVGMVLANDDNDSAGVLTDLKLATKDGEVILSEVLGGAFNFPYCSNNVAPCLADQMDTFVSDFNDWATAQGYEAIAIWDNGLVPEVECDKLTINENSFGLYFEYNFADIQKISYPIFTSWSPLYPCGCDNVLVP